ncbi:hypothetical protein MHU86_10805 [Fragilaria crotonensis]|nr:hypothetical protein MHU86_10805 [Fragilaria crotonensis]
MSAVAPEGLHGDNDEPEDDEASITRQASGGGDDGRDSYICASEQVYVESGNEKKVLYLMCLGLTHRTNNDSEEQPLFSFEQEPWSMLPKNSLLRPKNSDFVNKITRGTSCTFGRLPMSTKFYKHRYNVSTTRQGLLMHLVLQFQAGVVQRATTAAAGATPPAARRTQCSWILINSSCGYRPAPQQHQRRGPEENWLAWN